MKKTAVLLAILMLFSLAFTACSQAPAGGKAAEETTTVAPVAGSQENITEAVFAGENTTESASENAEDGIFYVG